MRAPSESTEAKALVRWVRAEHPKLLKIAHIPNEAMGGMLFEAAMRLKAEGVSRGFPDYIIVNVETHKLCIVELKRRTGGKMSDDQEAWLRAFGKRARVCCGHHEAIRFIKRKLLCS